MPNRYLSVIICSLKEGFLYKMTCIFSLINRLMEITIYLFIWKAVYGNSQMINGMNFEQIVVYYTITFSICHIMYFGLNEVMGEKIRSGKITMDLLYPMNYIDFQFCYKIGNTFRQIIAVSIPTFIIVCFMFSVSMSITWVSLVYFLFMMALAIVNVFLIEYIFGLIAFITNSIWGLQILKNSLIMVFSGALAPIIFFPQWMQALMKTLPFIDLIYSPVTALTGNISFVAFLQIILRQGIWAIILFILTNVLYKNIIKKITIFGG